VNEVEKIENPEPGTNNASSFNLGQWMGRREAFGLIAGRCSAAEIEIVKKIRDEKLYQSYSRDWEEFCPRHLHAVRRSVDREISYLQRFGPAFFTVRQLTHVSVREYEAIAGHITEQGVHVDGAVIPLHSDATDQLSTALEELLKRVGARDRQAEPVAFEALLKRCRTTASQLQSLDCDLDAAQRLELGDAVAQIRAAAAGLGITVWDRR
jgi:hypothetical protein